MLSLVYRLAVFGDKEVLDNVMDDEKDGARHIGLPWRSRRHVSDMEKESDAA